MTSIFKKNIYWLSQIEEERINNILIATDFYKMNLSN